ncbi:MAG: hypothetical protein K2I64_02390 [Muribaculaceae bacterium]|nr:hypothetical protein [Muribaculaceae bacterium]
MRNLLFLVTLLFSIGIHAENVRARMESRLIEDEDTLPATLDEWIHVLDSVLTDSEKRDLESIDLSQYEFYYWNPEIQDYLLSSDLLERACMYYDLFHQTPRYLHKREADLYSKMYDVIMKAYIKHLKGEPYKNYYDFPEPKNFDDFIAILEQGGWPEAVKVFERQIEDDSIVWEFEHTASTDDWEIKIVDVLGTEDYPTSLAKYIKNLSPDHEIYPEAIKKILLIAANKHFTGQPYDLSDIVARNYSYRELPMWMSTRNDNVDSINGIYVPIDLIDACRELDKLLDDSTKVEIVTLGKEFGRVAHHTLGMWIRNNWGLWGGSRLQAYLRSKGYGDPDEMSDYLLNCYQFWLESKKESDK